MPTSASSLYANALLADASYAIFWDGTQTITDATAVIERLKNTIAVSWAKKFATDCRSGLGPTLLKGGDNVLSGLSPTYGSGQGVSV
jgi:hypothetical protein